MNGSFCQLRNNATRHVYRWLIRSGDLVSVPALLDRAKHRAKERDALDELARCH